MTAADALAQRSPAVLRRLAGLARPQPERPQTRTLTIIKRSDDSTGFVMPPRRWVVERTFGWLIRHTGGP